MSIPESEVETLLEEWRDEIAKDRRRSRNWEGNLSAEYRLKGKADGMDICVHELQELIDTNNP